MIMLAVILSVVIVMFGSAFWEYRERDASGRKGLWWASVVAGLYSLYVCIRILLGLPPEAALLPSAIGVLLGVSGLVLMRRRRKGP